MPESIDELPPESDRLEMKPDPKSILPVVFATRFLQWGALGLVIPVSNLLRLAKGLTLAQLGFSAAVVSAVVIGLEVPSGILADRLGRKRVYMMSLGFFALSCLTLILSWGFLAVTVGFALYGVSRAFASGSLEALLIDRYLAYAGKEKLSRLMAVANAADTVGLATGVFGASSALYLSAGRRGADGPEA